MNQKDLIAKFLNLEDEDEEIVEAWNLFIAAQKAFRDVEARTLSRREGDNVRRTFLRHMGKHGLKTLNEEKGFTFAGNIYPWRDFYLTGGALRREKGEVSSDEKVV